MRRVGFDCAAFRLVTTRSKQGSTAKRHGKGRSSSKTVRRCTLIFHDRLDRAKETPCNDFSDEITGRDNARAVVADAPRALSRSKERRRKCRARFVAEFSNRSFSPAQGPGIPARGLGGTLPGARFEATNPRSAGRQRARFVI